MEKTKGIGFKREIGLLGLTFTGLAGVIGSGWLFAPVYAAQLAGPAAIFSWIIGGLMCLTLALVLAELGCTMPVASGPIRCATFSHGYMSSYIGGVIAYLGYVSAAPIEAAAVLEYIGNFFHGLDVIQDGVRVLTPLGIACEIGLLAIFTLMNYFGVKFFARANAALTWWKVVVPVVAPIIFIFWHFDVSNFTDHGGFFPHGVSGMFQAISLGGVVVSFLGFRAITELAGEARNPRRNVPLALVFTMLITLFVYLLIQISFIGAIGKAELGQGWSHLVADTASGPFAALAVAIGLVWLAPILYADAIISPCGTGLLFTGATSRMTYGMSRSGYFPKIFQKLNRNHVPGAGIITNFIIGCLFVLPFPSWQQLISVGSITLLVGLAYTPISLCSLRKNLPDLKRPFYMKYGFAFSCMAFAFANLMIYWSGWDTIWKVFLIIMGLLVIFLICFKANKKMRHIELNMVNSIWVWLFVGGILVWSYLGTYGGISFIPPVWDQLVVVAWSVIVFFIAIGNRLSVEQTRKLVEQNITPEEAMDEALK